MGCLLFSVVVVRRLDVIIRIRDRCAHPRKMGLPRDARNPRNLGSTPGPRSGILEDMWSELRADAARRELSALVTAGLDSATVQAAAADIVRRVVPFDATCWATVDPRSGVFTGSVTLQFDPSPELEARFAQIEAAADDVNAFRGLVATNRSVARLSDTDHDTLRASRRLAEIYRPLGFARELRAVFTADDRWWGLAELLRASGSPDFSARETAFMGSVDGVIADALRAAVLLQRQDRRDDGASSVVVVDSSGTVLAATADAERRLASLSRAARADAALVVRSVVAAVVHQGVERAKARVRDPDGAWFMITASPLRTASGADQIAVTLGPAPGADLTDLLLSAHALSGREQEICRHVLDGKSTADIAAALFISAHTVQDHLKSIFAKTGIRSRRELVAHLSHGGPSGGNG
jgi:DNA-binding CsgD family transcriptional regulator